MAHPNFRPAHHPIGRLVFVSWALALTSVIPAVAVAQSTAVNGTIEGTVLDASGGVLPGVTITVTSVDTGAQRVVVTNESGRYRAPLLPLGTYSLVAELEGFKRYEELGIVLSAGQTAVINVSLVIGSLQETVTVTGETPVVDSGKIDVGRNLGEREVKNLPLVSRNPYNFALLQPGVTGYENPEFGVPRFSANGTLLRINYQIDGNTNTQKDRAGLRLIPMSEVMIREVKVVTSGYAPEFGQSMGMVYNAVTPSGTNTIRGSASYRFRRKAFSAFPFFFQSDKTDENKPDTKINTWTAEVGGPIIKDRLHYFAGYENTYRDLSAQRLIQIDPAAAAQIGLAPQPPYVPWTQTAQFIIGKVDYQLSPNNRLMGRYIRFTNDSPNNGGGGLSAIETTIDFLDAMNSAATQLITTLGANKLNELRVQYADRHTTRFTNDLSGTGVTTSISGVASFGRPSTGTDFKQQIFQVVDNFTWIKGNHNFKAGFDAQWVYDERITALNFSYTFPTIAAYLAARDGINPKGYTGFSQTLGDPYFDMNSKLYGMFWQDDWFVRPNVKLLYGVRYDLYDYPDADPSSPFEYDRNYVIDKNNFGPRVGVAWTLGDDGRTVVRASTGLMYDQPLLGAYENAIQQNGQPNRVTVSLSPTAAGAPAYPGSLSDLPPGFALPAQTLFTVSPDFRVARTFQNNLQLERGLGRHYSMSVGVVYVRGYDLPVVNDINLINPTGTLADGRGIYSSALNSNTRAYPEFRYINTVEAVGTSTYKALTLQLARRGSQALQFDVNYSYGKGIDNAPTSGNLSFVSDAARSDPANLDRDKGPNRLDTRHNFSGSIVALTSFDIQSPALRAIVNNNQFAFMLQFNSGLPFNIGSNRNLNNDGSGGDRPLYVGRNSMYLPDRWNVDMRYSRFITVSGPRRIEIIGEFKNLLNTVQTSGVNSTIQVDLQGNPLSPIPTTGSAFPATSGYEQRAFQLGFKFYF